MHLQPPSLLEGNKRRKFTKLGLGAGGEAINIFYKASPHETHCCPPPLPVVYILCDPREKRLLTREEGSFPADPKCGHCLTMASLSSHGPLRCKDLQSRHLRALRGCQQGHAWQCYHNVSTWRSISRHEGLPSVETGVPKYREHVGRLRKAFLSLPRKKNYSIGNCTSVCPF